MALVGVKLKILVSEEDALTTRPPPCALNWFFAKFVLAERKQRHLPVSYSTTTLLVWWRKMGIRARCWHGGENHVTLSFLVHHL